MNNKNLGIAKAIVARSVVDEFINEGSIINTKKIVGELASVINQYPTLAAEMKIVESIENKSINDDLMATRFIDKSLNVMNSFSIGEILEGYEALSSFCDEKEVKKIDETKRNLYNAVSSLIVESLKTVDTDIDKLHESFEIVLSYIKENKKESTNDDLIIEGLSPNDDIDIDFIIEKSIEKFNKKYSTLNEEQKDILNKLVYGDTNIKKNIFESLKNENLEKLNSMDTNGVEDKINKAIQKLNEMQYNEDSSIDNIIELYELKENLV